MLHTKNSCNSTLFVFLNKQIFYSILSLSQGSYIYVHATLPTEEFYDDVIREFPRGVSHEVAHANSGSVQTCLKNSLGRDVCV